MPPSRSFWLSSSRWNLKPKGNFGAKKLAPWIHGIRPSFHFQFLFQFQFQFLPPTTLLLFLLSLQLQLTQLKLHHLQQLGRGLRLLLLLQLTASPSTSLFLAARRRHLYLLTGVPTRTRIEIPTPAHRLMTSRAPSRIRIYRISLRIKTLHMPLLLLPSDDPPTRLFTLNSDAI